MIDNALTKPFFVWNQNDKIVGSELTASWHNENKGVLLINNNHRNEDDIVNEDDINDFSFENEKKQNYEEDFEFD